MRFRVATLNLEQDHKRWEKRRELVIEQLGAVKPDVVALNEVCMPLRTAHWIRDRAAERFGFEYFLVQQTRANGLSAVEGEALLTRFPVIETGNLDYRARDIVALVARLVVGESPVDVYVTHQVRIGLQRFAASLPGAAAPGVDRQPGAHRGADRLRRFQRDARNAVCRADGEPLPADADRAHRVHAPGRRNGEVTHPDWARMDRCIDYIWISEALRVVESRVCFNQASPSDPTLWPSDHAGVWADLEL